MPHERTAPAITGIAALAIDCHDPPELARWWSRLLGGSVEVAEDGDTLRVPRAGHRLRARARVQDGQEPAAPGPAQQHLAEATAQALALGDRADDIYDQGAGRSCATPRQRVLPAAPQALRGKGTSGAAPGPVGSVDGQLGVVDGRRQAQPAQEEQVEGGRVGGDAEVLLEAGVLGAEETSPGWRTSQ